MSLLAKYRIIGLIAVIAILAIFVPYFIRQHETVQLKLSTSMPNPPAKPQVVLQLDSVPSVASSVAPTVASAAAKQEQAKQSSIIKPEPTAAQSQVAANQKLNQTTSPVVSSNIQAILPVTKSWALQLASYADADNAKRLTKQLRQAGFTAYMQSSKLKSNQMITRVFVGPELDKQKLQAVQKTLLAKFKLQGLVVQTHMNKNKGGNDD